MQRLAIFLYGVFAYVLFLAVFGYMAAFLLQLLVPKAINDPGLAAPGGLFGASVVNVALIAFFGLLHSLLARDWMKEKLYAILPRAAERSTYVVQSSLCLALAMWLWQPMDMTLWSLAGPSQIVPFATFALGAAIVLWSTFLIDHFELFGLRQSWTHLRGTPMPTPEFKTPALYRIVRHPMQLGIIILLFSTPQLTVGHLLFAGSMTAYIFVGLYFEERALLRMFGARYAAYQRNVPFLFPRLVRRNARQPRKAEF
ncbi:NnrU family protein [Ruegeria sp. 2205SS24-7]|uniref:methyltransferase family protein n=1 Tax=Ruegeria discodermiae TaxID=3064389 RepID=UPI0027403763|nr:NnrU family protein [Ruegeria sp. 2205SS24-7]MDP5218746.1 NnrU family protein [Ruegeria sp. 2205SS24-7]